MVSWLAVVKWSLLLLTVLLLVVSTVLCKFSGIQGNQSLNWSKLVPTLFTHFSFSNHSNLKTIFFWYKCWIILQRFFSCCLSFSYPLGADTDAVGACPNSGARAEPAVWEGKNCKASQRIWGPEGIVKWNQWPLPKLQCACQLHLHLRPWSFCF